MALCSYDNELNTKYKYNKGFEMARQTAKQVKEAQENAKVENVKEVETPKQEEIEPHKEEVGTFVDTDETQLPIDETLTGLDAEEDGTMHIVDAMTLAERGVKMVRLGWNKELRNHYVTIARGETKPTFTTGKHGSPFQPSIVDVLAHDWVEMEDK